MKHLNILQLHIYNMKVIGNLLADLLSVGLLHACMWNHARSLAVVDSLRKCALTFLGGNYGLLVDRSRLQTVVENIFKKTSAHETAKQAFTQDENTQNPSYTVSEATAYLQIIDTFSLPKYIYDCDRKTFMKPVTTK